MRPRGMSLEETFRYYALGKRPAFEQIWHWNGPRTNRGTAVFYWRGRQYTALRTSHELFVGPVPHDQLVLNRYGRPLDVNPRNLILGQGRGLSVSAGRLRQPSQTVRRPEGLTQNQALDYFLPFQPPGEPWWWTGGTDPRGIPMLTWGTRRLLVPALMYRRYIDASRRPGFIVRNKFGDNLDVNPHHLELKWQGNRNVSRR